MDHDAPHVLHYPLNGLHLDFTRYRHHTITGLDIIAIQLLEVLHDQLPPLSQSLDPCSSSLTQRSPLLRSPSSTSPLYLALSRAVTLQPHHQPKKKNKRPQNPSVLDLYDLLQRWHVQSTSDHLRHLLRREKHYINTAPDQKLSAHTAQDSSVISHHANALLSQLQSVKVKQHQLHIYSGKGFGNVIPRFRKLERRTFRDMTRTPQVTAPFPPGPEISLHNGVWPTQHLLNWSSDPSLAPSGPLLGGQDLCTSFGPSSIRGRKRSRSLVDLNRFAIADIPNSLRESKTNLRDEVFYQTTSLESIEYRLRSRSLSPRRISAMFLPCNTPSYDQGTTSQQPPIDTVHKFHSVRMSRCSNCASNITDIYHSLGCTWVFCGHCGSREHFAPYCPVSPSNRCKCTAFPTFHRASNCPIPCTRSCGNPLPAGHPRHRSAMMCESRCCMCGIRGHSGLKCRLKKCRCGQEGHLGQDCGWKVECRVNGCDRFLCGKHCRGCGSEQKPFVQWRCRRCLGDAEGDTEKTLESLPRGRGTTAPFATTNTTTDIKTEVKTRESIFG